MLPFVMFVSILAGCVIGIYGTKNLQLAEYKTVAIAISALLASNLAIMLISRVLRENQQQPVEDRRVAGATLVLMLVMFGFFAMIRHFLI